MSRKEREQADKEKAAADYRRRHELGLTEEYKRDMAKLEEVRKRREAAAQRALEENEIKEAAEKEARQRALKMGMLEDDEDDQVDEPSKDDKKKKKSIPVIPKLDKITIKKMKPTQLKEALKARNLDIQGNAKELTDRLLEYEAAR
jgi:isopentenyldiphosphate isomerase